MNPNKISKEQREKDCNYLRWELCKEDVPTASLIAELEKRRPCSKCQSFIADGTPCQKCLWRAVWCSGDLLFPDNFKESEHE